MSCFLNIDWSRAHALQPTRRILRIVPRHVDRFLFIVCLTGGLVVSCLAASEAQVMGEEAEMERLRVKAEEAIANDDPDGAAMSAGRAALMAAQLAKNQNAGPAMRLYQGAESLFRSQEHAYRALSLFRRAGGQLPASSGVCGSLRLARSSLQHSLETLEEPAFAAQPESVSARAARLRASAEDWVTVIASMNAEYRCE